MTTPSTLVWDVAEAIAKVIDNGTISDRAGAAALTVVLRAMREPSEAMLVNVGTMDGAEHLENADPPHIKWWQAMLDAFARENGIEMGCEHEWAENTWAGLTCKKCRAVWPEAEFIPARAPSEDQS